MDKLTNAGGKGGEEASASTSDSSIVREIMWAMVEHLYNHWREEEERQQTGLQRLRKAVKRIALLRRFQSLNFSSCPGRLEGESEDTMKRQYTCPAYFGSPDGLVAQPQLVQKL